jgi:hypothetical protein
MFVTTVADGVRALAEEWKNKGEYLRSHILHALALEGAEAFSPNCSTRGFAGCGESAIPPVRVWKISRNISAARSRSEQPRCAPDRGFRPKVSPRAPADANRYQNAAWRTRAIRHLRVPPSDEPDRAGRPYNRQLSVRTLRRPWNHQSPSPGL